MTNTTSLPANPQRDRTVVRWLISIALLILLMVILGGITRLTQSGLSMVDWRPIMGAIPPISETDWQETFDQYKQFPQYVKVNQSMTLSEFKTIFFWEYIHRLLGRFIGLFVLLPWIYFNIKRRFDRKTNLRVLLLFTLGGLQGVLGWYMVQSGLIDLPQVSHYRLAAHLALAFVTMCATAWVTLDLWYGTTIKTSAFPRLLTLTRWLLALICLQVLYGAFMAGLKAGLGHNTFPTMSGQWIPSGLLIFDSLWANLLDNTIMIQFIHRQLGWLALIGFGWLFYAARNTTITGRQKKMVHTAVGITAVQFILGALTIIFAVPVWLAVAHQATAALLLVSLIALIHALRSPAPQSSQENI
jgi:cytochrome c oxidase assembly protein subunit 15